MQKMLRILILDDQPHDRYLISRSLREEGYHTRIVDNTDLAWEYIEGFQIDMVLMNSLAEGFDGFALLLDIKQRRPEFPVIVYAIRSLDAIDKLKESITGVWGKERPVESGLRSDLFRSVGSRFRNTVRFGVSLQMSFREKPMDTAKV